MSRRDQIRMTEPEIATFLAQGRTLSVATINPNGEPHLVAMWYALWDGKVAFWTYAKSQKAVNLRRDPRITCLLESGATYTELRGVQIHGHATLTDAPATVQALGEAVYQRNNASGELSAQDRRTIAAQAPKRIAVIVEPISIASWDHTKLGGVR